MIQQCGGDRNRVLAHRFDRQARVREAEERRPSIRSAGLIREQWVLCQEFPHGFDIVRAATAVWMLSRAISG